jgi:hypothetical protein
MYGYYVRRFIKMIFVLVLIKEALLVLLENLFGEGGGVWLTEVVF